MASDVHINDLTDMVIAKRRMSEKARKRAKLAAAAAVVGGVGVSTRVERTKSKVGHASIYLNGNKVTEPSRTSSVNVKIAGRNVAGYEHRTGGVTGRSHRNLSVGGTSRGIRDDVLTQQPQYLLPAYTRTIGVTGGSRKRRIGISTSKMVIGSGAGRSTLRHRRLMYQTDGRSVPTRRQERRVVREAEQILRQQDKKRRRSKK